MRRGAGAVPSRLLEHVQHLGLKDGIDRFYGDSRAALGHGKDVNHADRVVVHKLAQHQAHHLHGNAGTTYCWQHPGKVVDELLVASRPRPPGPIPCLSIFISARLDICTVSAVSMTGTSCPGAGMLIPPPSSCSKSILGGYD